ncbi:thiopeptide-type bacteriocin biosynthesis protein [Streptomyces sp. H-KF8]|uniref:thiopeptide-type bacteriocin biosynthesis protein n=1 Tax=Streptomyces sp. H-KF8 TaxID=1727216 RepID=UPI0007ED0B2C|nr:thiopeptide-type bacteriocin biosynthesis protein [Streptomyces sp. H-KF8]
MSADRLSPPPASDTERAVREVLAGSPLDEVASHYDLREGHLSDAATVFVEAGREALLQHAAIGTWWQINLAFTEPAAGDRAFTAHLLPVLRATDLDSWWFMRKHPGYRVRVSASPSARARVKVALDQFVATGHVREWRTVVYEPETVAFGGEPSMRIAHDLFAADSLQIQQLASQDTRLPIGLRELSVLLCTTMMRGAGLEWYETGDVWNRVITAEGRSTGPSPDPAALPDRAQEIRALLLADTQALFGHEGVLRQARDWASAFQRAGRNLRRTSDHGALGRGLRDVLSLHVIFHWNRLGLSLRTQSHLAAAARSAIFDRAR